MFYLLSGKILAAPVISVISPLTFPAKSAQITENLVVAPSDAGAAVLRVSGGTPLAAATCSLGKNSVIISTPPGTNNSQKITVNNWTISCPGAFDAAGIMDVRLGATAVKDTTDIAGDFTENTQSLIITY